MKKNLFFTIICCMVYQTAVSAMNLQEAARNGNIEQVRALLAAGANPNLQNEAGNTPLRWAAGHGHQEIVKMLLDNGANVNQQNGLGWTPLRVAVYKGHQAVVKMLLDNGANVNQQANSGWTPLHGAAQNGHQEIVQMLLSAGADMKQCFNGWTPLYLATQKGLQGIIQLMKNHEDFLKNVRKEIEAILQARHLRLGANSPANILSENMCRQIFEYLKHNPLICQHMHVARAAQPKILSRAAKCDI
jgi:ankyrin repeat protein